jgi:hypothetical protein
VLPAGEEGFGAVCGHRQEYAIGKPLAARGRGSAANLLSRPHYPHDCISLGTMTGGFKLALAASFLNR